MYTYIFDDCPETEGCPILFVAETLCFDSGAGEIPPDLREDLPGFISLTVIGETTCVARFAENADRLRESADRLTAYLEKSCRQKVFRPEVQRTLDYIKSHPCESLSWSYLSREAYLSPEYCRRIFKAETGMTLKQCQTLFRLELAATLLVKTDLGSKEIAERVGYHQPSYFIRRFREQYGVSPKLLRNCCNVRKSAVESHMPPAV